MPEICPPEGVHGMFSPFDDLIRSIPEPYTNAVVDNSRAYQKSLIRLTSNKPACRSLRSGVIGTAPGTGRGAQWQGCGLGNAEYGLTTFLHIPKGVVILQ